MNRENIILWRNILLGVLVALLFFVATIAFWNSATAWVAYLFNVDQRALGRIVLQFFINVRLIIVFLFLVPALALHWTAKKTANPAG